MKYQTSIRITVWNSQLHIWHYKVQYRSPSRDLKSDYSKSRLFEDWISNAQVFKGLGYSFYSLGPNYLKTRHFCLDFKWFFTKWWPFVLILNGWASGFQIPFKIWTICKPTSFLASRRVRISDLHCEAVSNTYLGFQ